MAKDKSPEQIVDEVESALKDSHACPYCGMMDGTHTVTCEYLKHKGNVDAGRVGKSNKAVKTEAPVLEESTEEDKGKDSEERSEEESSQAELLERMKPKK